MGASIGCVGGEVFGWSQQPEEGDDDEAEAMEFHGTKDWVGDGEDFVHVADDGGVDWVGS